MLARLRAQIFPDIGSSRRRYFECAEVPAEAPSSSRLSSSLLRYLFFGHFSLARASSPSSAFVPEATRGASSPPRDRVAILPSSFDSPELTRPPDKMSRRSARDELLRAVYNANGGTGGRGSKTTAECVLGYESSLLLAVFFHPIRFPHATKPPPRHAHAPTHTHTRKNINTDTEETASTGIPGPGRTYSSLARSLFLPLPLPTCAREHELGSRLA